MVNNLLVISATSDIGYSYCIHSASSFKIGTYRQETSNNKLREICNKLFYLDIANEASISSFVHQLDLLNYSWDRLLFCPCQPHPYENFFEGDIEEWMSSFAINSLHQLRILHKLYHYRSPNSKVIFFAGGGTNSSVVAFSAYTSAKIHLIKMVELLDSENPDITFSILGPGWVNTKTHLEAIKHSSIYSEKYNETLAFLDNPKGETPMSAVMTSLDWIYSQPKKIVGGRNFSTAYDPIDCEDSRATQLAENLSNDHDMYKLRRSGNAIYPSRRF